ncbi:hypothetical protein SAMN05421752_106194 [Natronorubrum thiooxidans]|uniref:Uncharacterized protein n=1 Tax=Natronorubrum thiooxidans TaxID=308853 RepID=A0A1N7FCE0_9EURY|nr:hypothetical protein SAMN05421752_106194 [Natronorubrum thiooxidans]
MFDSKSSGDVRSCRDTGTQPIEQALSDDETLYSYFRDERDASLCVEWLRQKRRGVFESIPSGRVIILAFAFLLAIQLRVGLVDPRA